VELSFALTLSFLKRRVSQSFAEYLRTFAASPSVKLRETLRFKYRQLNGREQQLALDPYPGYYPLYLKRWQLASRGLMNSTEFCFVHAADLHLDTPFEGIGRTAPEISQLLRDASLQAFDNLVELTLRRQASFLLLAGDIYDGHTRGVRAQLRFLRGLTQLAQAGIPVFIVHGNHDPLNGWSAIKQWPDGVQIFSADEVQALPVLKDGVQLATVYGISYRESDVSENLALRFKRRSFPGLQIGLLHANISSQKEQTLYSPCSVSDLMQAGMDYWALGHLHLRELIKQGDPWIAYPGNLQGRSPKPSEQGEKGALVVHVSGGRIDEAEFAPCDIVRFVTLELDIAAETDLGTLKESLIRAANKLVAANCGRHLLVRTKLTGRGLLNRDLNREHVREELLAELRDDVRGQLPVLWWESISSQTHAVIDFDAIAQRGDFSAELLNVASNLENNPQVLAELVTECLKPARRAHVLRLVAPPESPEKHIALLKQATTLALELVEREQD
jgi:DNA repair protein SbcD/Mre11